MASLSLKGGTNASSGFKLVLIDSTGTKIYESAAQTVAAAATVSPALNWYIAPGAYMLIIDDSNADADDDPTTDPATGDLVYLTAAEFPYKISTEVELLGGIDNKNFANINADANYFFDWDVTIYATGTTDPFDVTLKWIELTASPVTCNVTTGASDENAKITIQSYFSFVQRVGYSIGSQYTGPDFSAADTMVVAAFALISTLSNPKINQPYVVRAFSDATTYKDFITVIDPVKCESSNLSLTVSPAAKTSAKGEGITYIFTLTNTGPDISTNIKVRVPIPNLKKLLSALPSLGEYSELTQLWTISSLPVGTATLSFTIEMD